jgi:HlyD family secretion protein
LKRLLVSLLFIPLLISCNSKEITSDKLDKQVIPVEVTKVDKKNLSETIELSGIATPSIIYPIITQTPSLVENVYVNVGDRVNKNETLLLLNKAAAQEQYDLAKKAVNQLEQLLNSTDSTRAEQALQQFQQLQEELNEAVKRSQALLEGLDTGAVTALDMAQSTLEVSLKQAQVAQAAALLQSGNGVSIYELQGQLAEAKQKLKQAEILLENMTIKAPITGFVADINVFENGLAVPNTPVATIIQIDPIHATFQLNSFQISKVTQGMKANVTFEGVNDTYTGSISSVSPTANIQTNAFQVEIPITNSDGNVKGGMKATAKLEIDEIQQALVIPAKSIIYIDDETFVYLAKDGKAIKQKISIGFRSGELVQVNSGLSHNQFVITNGKERVTDGASISVRNE